MKPTVENSDNKTFSNIDFLKKHAYLFLVDIDQISKGETYQKYEERELGYGNAMLKAINFAFNEDIHRKISPMFIKNIHKNAMSHIP